MLATMREPLGKLLNLSEAQFTHPGRRINALPPQELLWELNEMV